MNNIKIYYLILYYFIFVLTQGHAQQKDSLSGFVYKEQQLKEVVVSAGQILGSKFQARNRTGSAYYVSPQELGKFGYTDINRMLKAVPGVNMYEEDGFGLRPNISLRGTKAERSERITIMEDGVLAAPAPYSAPAAYYFPNAARMHAVEVLKGSSQVQYGPFTTGGAINMVSIPIPTHFTGKADISYGSNNTLKGHAYIGDLWRHFGYMVEYLRYQSDGFKRSAEGNKFGFGRNDVIAKLLFKTAGITNWNHSLELKFGFANENSDESYVGLSEEDFKASPFLRYAGSKMDNLTTHHTQWVATYNMDWKKRLKLTANAYYNYFHRNWYKLNDARVGITKGEKRSIAQILEDPETNSRYFDILTGKVDYDGEALIIRANNRTYRSRGLQAKLEYRFNIKDFYINLEGGLRYHRDEEDRFQWDDGYSMTGGQMKLFVPGLHGTNANRLTSAEAWSGYVLTKLNYKTLTLTTGLRYEDVDLLKKDYTTADLQRTGHIRIETPNHARAFIPSLGLHWQALDVASLFFGIHKGFAPPSAELYQKAENSVNMELGVRVSTPNFGMEFIGFFNAYSNMLGSDLAASGGSGTLDQFNVGKADVKGLEFLVRWQPLPMAWKVRLPLQLSYTYTDTKMKNSFVSGAWGNVFVGDEIPYIYKHSLNMQTGLEYGRYELTFGMKYNGDMRTVPGQGHIANSHKIPSHIILDASARMAVNRWVTLTLNAVNLTDKVYLASRHPSGLRAGHPFGIFGGVKIQF
uniref:TonB-dependent receptor n=1 Tax=Prevotella sp. GTC17253 TaxID=3236793 RepID=A0AB33IMU1_9BACT